MLLGHKVKTIKELPEAEALKQGADLIGETFIFSVAAGLLVLEYTRQTISTNRANEAKEKKRKDKMDQLNAHFNDLEERIKILERENQNLRVLVEVATQKQGPSKEKADRTWAWDVFSYFPGATIRRTNSA